MRRFRRALARRQTSVAFTPRATCERDSLAFYRVGIFLYEKIEDVFFSKKTDFLFFVVFKDAPPAPVSVS